MSFNMTIATNVHADNGQGGTDAHAFGSDGTLPVLVLAEFVSEGTALDPSIQLCPFLQVSETFLRGGVGWGGGEREKEERERESASSLTHVPPFHTCCVQLRDQVRTRHAIMNRFIQGGINEQPKVRHLGEASDSNPQVEVELSIELNGKENIG
jgi:hypothetical protein